MRCGFEPAPYPPDGIPTAWRGGGAREEGVAIGDGVCGLGEEEEVHITVNIRILPVLLIIIILIIVVLVVAILLLLATAAATVVLFPVVDGSAAPTAPAFPAAAIAPLGSFAAVGPSAASPAAPAEPAHEVRSEEPPHGRVCKRTPLPRHAHRRPAPLLQLVLFLLPSSLRCTLTCRLRRLRCFHRFHPGGRGEPLREDRAIGSRGGGGCGVFRGREARSLNGSGGGGGGGGLSTDLAPGRRGSIARLCCRC